VTGEEFAGFWWGTLKETDHLEDPRIDGTIRLRWIYKECDVGYGLDQAGSG
jgi:hypothetical protein